jgi:hypothetical protein
MLLTLFNVVVETLLILVVGIIIGRWLGRFVLRFMKEVEINNLFRKATRIRLSLDKFVSLQVTYTIYLITLILVAIRLGILEYLLWTILALFLVVLFVSVGLYLLGLLPNLLARWKLRGKKLAVLKRLEVGSLEGRILKLGVQEVVLDSGVVIPYYYLLKTKFKVS